MAEDFKSLIPFNKEHAHQIRKMVLIPGETLVCPACGAELDLGPPVAFEGHHVRQLQCRGCGRGTMIHDR